MTASQSTATRPWRFSTHLLAEYLGTTWQIDSEAVQSLVDEAVDRNVPFGRLLVERTHVTQPALRDAMASAFGLLVATLPRHPLDADLHAGFPAQVAREFLFVPLAREETRLALAVADPTLEQPLRAIRRAIGLTLDLRLAPAEELQPLVDEYFAPALVALLPSGETVTARLQSNELRIGTAETSDLISSSNLSTAGVLALD